MLDVASRVGFAGSVSIQRLSLRIRPIPADHFRDLLCNGLGVLFHQDIDGNDGVRRRYLFGLASQRVGPPRGCPTSSPSGEFAQVIGRRKAAHEDVELSEFECGLCDADAGCSKKETDLRLRHRLDLHWNTWFGVIP